MDYAITDKEFRQFRTLVYQQSGISLSESKKALLVSRLSRRLRQLGLKKFQAYYDCIEADSGKKELTCMLDLVSTNKTDFFREQRHFEFLRNRILPELRQSKQIRVWSAGCSSGEEAYSIAMTLYDWAVSPQQWNFKILASDLSTHVLVKAKSGIYEPERISTLSDEIIRRHFLKGKVDGIDKVKIKPHISNIVVFRKINLMDGRYPIKTPLDIIFCRNVMIYFDRKTQERLVGRFYHYLRPGGYLFIGHSESLQWVEHQFSYVEPTIYRKET